MQKQENASASFPRRSDFQQRLQSSTLWPIEHKQVQAHSVFGILCARQKSRFDETFNRFSYLLHFISHKGSKLLVRKQRAWMPMQKHQQIEVAGGPNDRSASQQALYLFLQIVASHECAAVDYVTAFAALPP